MSNKQYVFHKVQSHKKNLNRSYSAIRLATRMNEVGLKENGLGFCFIKSVTVYNNSRQICRPLIIPYSTALEKVLTSLPLSKTTV